MRNHGMGPSGLEMGVGGDLGLRGDLLSRTLQVPVVSILFIELRRRRWVSEGVAMNGRELTPSLENPIQVRTAFFGIGTIPS